MAEWIVKAETLADLVDGRWTASTKKIVRCKDCEYWDNSNKYPYCWFHDENTEADDFCSRGERRTE